MATQTLNHLILYMKRELSAILGLLLSVAIFAQKERNVTLTLSVDSFISSQEQTAYLYGYIGNECEIYDSWASWCRPCIQAMPNIIQAQRMFKDDFVCCAVTIDKSERPWQESIKTFSLQELQHFKGTDDEGQILPEIDRLIPDRTIPRNYLLNREGKIIATDIYDEALISKLKRIIKKRPNDFPLYEND